MSGSSRGDPSNGYEAVSEAFMAHRTRSPIGVATVRAWASTLRPGGDILDLGCGHGVPIAEALVRDGFTVSGVDASASMLAAFRARFPEAATECGPVEDSRFFGHQFDGAVAWGLMFLLTPDVQAQLVQRVGAALKPGGRFLFTAPRQPCEWSDMLTGRRSVSLGAEAYQRLLERAGLILDDQAQDDAQNHYFFVRKPSDGESAP